MLTLTSQHNPQWVLMPVNNDRTAWRPFGLPMVLVVPDRRNPLGQPLPNSDISCIKVYIEDVPNASLVVGQNHIIQAYDTDACDNPIPNTAHFEQLRFPDKALYSITVSTPQLISLVIHLNSVDYYNYSGGNYIPITQDQATAGSYFQYTSASGVTDYIPFLPSADYYDFSSILLAVEPLPPDRYVLVYQCEYYSRVTSNDTNDELLCIDTNTLALGLYRFLFNHPGEVMGEFYRLTPATYLTSVNKSQDTTLSVYRPLTDALQDIYDEQSLLRQVNWIDRIPDHFIPYLSTLLGWSLPYFPNSDGGLQRVLLKNTSLLQSIKGSRQAVIEVFRLLGIDILVNNLWWSQDGKIFIAPGENLDEGYVDQQITINAIPQLEPLLVEYTTDGMGGMLAPLLHRPQVVGGLNGFTAPQDGGDVYITSYLVEVGSAAHQTLTGIVNNGLLTDPDSWSASYEPNPLLLLPAQNDHLYEKDYISQQLLNYYFDQDGLLVPTAKLDGLGSYSQVRVVRSLVSNVVSGPLAIPISQATISSWAAPAVTTTGIQFDRSHNRLTINFNGYQDFSGDYDLPGPRVQKTLFVFASYVQQVYAVPTAIQGLQSNRFDIQLLQATTVPALAGQYSYVDPQILDFAVELLGKVKAFHSLLNTVQVIIELTETYEVTDMCVGGNIQQRYDTMMGRLQVPPAIIPGTPSETDCAVDPYTLGYKQADIVFRLMKLANLPEEHAAWKALDALYTNMLWDASTNTWIPNPNTAPSYRDGAEVYSLNSTRIQPNRPAPDRTECRFTSSGQDRVLVQGKTDVQAIEAGPSPNAAQFTVNSGSGVTISPDEIVTQGIFPTSSWPVNTNKDSSAFGWFTRQYTEQVEVPECELDGVTDYCYKGRAQDELLHRLELPCREIYRNKPTGLQLGTGVYWTYNAISREVIAGCAQPSLGSKTEQYWLTAGAKQAYMLNYKNTNTQEGIVQTPYLNAPYNAKLQDFQNTYLGKLYQAYGNPQTQTLHYGNRIMPVSWSQTATLALQRPSIDLQLATLHFPGCRFPKLVGLPQDFVSDTWMAKPWDDPYSQQCIPAQCSNQPTWLNAQLVPNARGDLVLSYDQVPYAITGDGLDPDIPGLDDHTGGGIEQDRVVHAVYSCARTGHPAITLDAVDYSDAAEITGVTDPLFSTYNNCSDNLHNEYMIDYIDGYPSVVGEQAVQFSYNRNWVTFETLPATAIFFLGDGILMGTGYRLDALCLTAGCDYSDDVYSCNVLNRDPCTLQEDSVELLPVVQCQEKYTMHGAMLDGSIPSLFELLPSCPKLQMLPMLNNDDVRCANIPQYQIVQDITFAP